MPLDIIDFEKIQAVVDRAVLPLTAKIDTVNAGLIPRQEYEKRHEHIVMQVEANKTDIRDLRQWAYTEHEKLRKDNEAIRDELDKKHGEMMKALGELKDEISGNRLITLRSIVGYIISFLIGGASLVGLLQALHLIH